eukprot:symbB.v1.2.030985.t1/scaffold3546.1/size54311/3
MEDPWLWAETDSHSEGFHSEGDAETGNGESEVWHRLCALQHGLAEVERKISKHSSLQEARHQRCTRNRHRWVLQKNLQVSTRFRNCLPPGVALASPYCEDTPPPTKGSLPPRASAPRAPVSRGGARGPPRRAVVLSAEPQQPAFCLEEQVPLRDHHRDTPYRTTLRPQLPEPTTPVPPVESVASEHSEEQEVLQTEEEMLRELQLLSNSFQPESAQSSSTLGSHNDSQPNLKDVYLRDPNDPEYSLHLKGVERKLAHVDLPNKSAEEEEHSVQSGLSYLRAVLQDSQAARKSSASRGTTSMPLGGDARRPSVQSDLSHHRHAVFQDSQAAPTSSASRGTTSMPLGGDTRRPSVQNDTSSLGPPRSHRHAVFGPKELATLGASLDSAEGLPSKTVGQESSESVDVQQILKDLRDNESSHMAAEDVDSLEGLEDEESQPEESEEAEESEGVQDALVEMENGSLGGEPLELEKLPPQEVLVNIYDVVDSELQTLRKSEIHRLLRNAYTADPAMGCGSSSIKVMDFDDLSHKPTEENSTGEEAELDVTKQTTLRSWNMTAVPGVALPPNRAMHEKYVRKLERYLSDIEKVPQRLRSEVALKRLMAKELSKCQQ